MTLPAIVNTARTLSYYSSLQDIVANNLANASSDGYKADRVTAQSSLDQPHPMAVQSIDLAPGELRDTNRPFDLALQGNGFFVVRTADGERLTRAGGFDVSADGVLVDRHGDPVLGTDGDGLLHVTGNKVSIEPDGSITVDGQRAGTLRLDTVADPHTLLKQGNGLFIPNGPTQPATDVGVHQGALEDSNVNPLMGSVDLLMIQRAYASSIDALRAMDGVLGTVTSDIARV
jgi:flagellar basal-body rod protein FlgF